MKIINTEQCSFCNTHVETLTHLFWECIYVEELRNKLVDWINSTLNVDIDITVIDVIFGRYRIFHNIFNVVLMITKRCIYKKCCNQIPYFEGAKNEVLYYKKNEKYKYDKYGNSSNFAKRWGIFAQIE